MAWAINLKDKYWKDPFFRSEFNVIALQFVFAGVLLLLVGISFNYLYQDVSEILIRGIAESIRTGGHFTSSDISSAIKNVKTEKLYGFIILTSVITFGFSYIIAKITLVPVRNALSSQKRFVSDIAHELRTPLSVIKTRSEVSLMDEHMDPDMQKSFLSIIEELNRTSDIINNLLTLGSVASPDRMRFVTVDMATIIDNSVLKLKDLAKQKEIEVTVKKVVPHTVLGNVTALEQIVVNLLKNALNYTYPQGRVFISVVPDYRGKIVLTIEDNGVGMSPSDLKHIFEPFYRAERSRNRASGSSGLGLTIVSELVKAHSGHITIQSMLNKGTRVIVSLPYHDAEDDIEKTS